MIYKEDSSVGMVGGESNIVLQLSLSDQEGKTITISQNGVSFEVITRDTSGLLERKTL